MANTYRVTGMSCGGCARSMEAAIKAVIPEAVVSVDWPNSTVTVEGVSEEQMKSAVAEAGFAFEGAA